MRQWFDRRSAHQVRIGASVVLLLFAAAVPALAQVPVESAGGVRALGMAGAFTAVADDATATWWNPAGLSTLLADFALEGGADDLVDRPDEPLGDAGAWRARPFSLAVALPMVGFSYNHLRVNDIRRTATGAGEPGRQDPAAVEARTFEVSTLGVSLVQSLGDYVVVGGTVKVLHAGAGSRPIPAETSVDAGLEAAGRLETTDRTVADADLGAMAFAGPLRLALVARNLGGHRFGAGAEDEQFRLERNVRVGAAFGTGPAWIRRPWTVAVDADLTTTHAPDGDRRTLAFGGERWLGAAQRVALRAGARVQTLGDLRPTVSGGASVAVLKGVFAEGQVSGGGDRSASGWGLAARVTF